MRVIQSLRQLLQETRGATAVEYGLIAALIVIAAIVGMQEMANANSNMWNRVSSTMTDATA